jgi:hypothetical protein
MELSSNFRQLLYSSAYNMRRFIFFLVSGIICAAFFIDAISVYLLRDVDHDQIGHLNAAFAGLCAESVIFALLIGVPTGLFTLAGERLLHLRGHSPREMLSLLLGIGVTAFQYPWDYIARSAFPKSANLFLDFYIVIAVVVCTVVLLRDAFRQMKLYGAAKASSSA